MGDRTSCTLTIWGLLPAAEIETLTEALKNAGADPETEKSVEDALRAEVSCFYFYEVNYGEIDAGLAACLQEIGLGYSWSWDSGGGYGPGLELHDPLTGADFEFATSGGEICLCLREIDDPKIVAEARAAQTILDNQEIRLAVFSSAHHLAALVAEGKVSSALLEAWRARSGSPD